MSCRKCKYRQKVSGSAHSKCSHPVTKRLKRDHVLAIFAMLSSVGRFPPIPFSAKVRKAGKKLNLRATMNGVTHGWFNWPFDFDPVWLENCDGFEKIK